MTESWYAEYAFRSGTVFVQDVSKEEPELVADDIRSEEDARLIAAAPDFAESADPGLLEMAANKMDRYGEPDFAGMLRIKAKNERDALAKAEGR